MFAAWEWTNSGVKFEIAIPDGSGGVTVQTALKTVDDWAALECGWYKAQNPKDEE